MGKLAAPVRADKDMMFTNHQLVTLMWPLLLEQFLAITVGLADSLMVATVGDAAISAVSLVDSISNLMIYIFSAMATGGAAVAGQYIGQRQKEDACNAGQQLIALLGAVSVFFVALLYLFRTQILTVMFGHIEPDVMAATNTYYLYVMASIPGIALYNGGAALFRAQGNSRISMLASLVMNVINIAGNALLIYGFGMGVIGAALATLIGRVFAAVFILWQNQDLHNPLRVQHFADLRPRRRPIMQILSIGIPSGLENGMFQIGKLCVSSLTSTLGTSAIAANAVANSVSTLANIPGNTMSLAMIPVIGQCLGAGEKKQAQRYSVTLLGIAVTGLTVTNAALFFLMPEVVTWFSLSTEASTMCTHVVHWFNLFSVFFWATSFTLPNALRAGGDAKFTMSVSIVSMWLFRVILSYIFVLQFHLGLTGVWFGMFIDWICRSLCFLVRFARGKWMEHKVI